ncbi:MAG TPA: serpin family protein, partial [Euzebya sp.]|nr:serpin family protein [Euzebya sp.]
DDAAAVGQAVNAFGFDLLTQLTDGSETVVTSPLSIATMLAMVLAGAGGDTAQAMADVLHLEDARDVRVGALLDRLVDTEDVTVSVANGLWANRGTPFQPDYLQFTQRTFDATLEEADLGAQATAEEIDAWVREQTRDLIDGIAADLGLPDPQAVLVLLNAVYFLGQWTTQFDPARTNPEPFTLPDGSEVEVPMMRMSGEPFGYAEGEGYRMLRLPYGESGRYGMEVLLPDGDLPSLLQHLDAQGWVATVERLQETEVDQVALPRFELEWEAGLTQPLDQLGMGVLFGPSADLSPMSPAAASLDSVVHKTYIRVDEEGTEAAAVTGGAVVTSVPVDQLLFEVDRPFAFTISDAETGTILFLGTVTDPRG